MTKLFHMLFAVLVLIEHYKVQAVVDGEWVKDIRHTNYVAGLFHYGKFACGATIISERRVVTAAHCVMGIPMSHHTSGIVLSFGSLDTNQYDITRYVKTEDILVHPNYTTGVFHHDIAVLEFEEPLDFTNPRIGKAKLVPKNYVPSDGEAVMLLGFTHTDVEFTQIAYSKLRYVLASVKDFAKCKAETESRVSDRLWLDGKSQICLNLEGGRHNMNQGDSGGPLVTRDGRYLGIVSNALNSVVEVAMNIGAYHTFLNNPRDYPGIGVSSGIKRQHYDWWNLQ